MTDKISKTYHALGTKIDLTVYGEKYHSILDETFELICHYERLFTIEREDSELMQVNRSSGVEAVKVSKPVYELTKFAIEKSREQFGFNVAIGPLVKLWHIGFSDAKLPEQSEISQALELTNPEDIEFDDENHSIFLKKKGMQIDLGGIAKGYIADKIKEYWLVQGAQAGIINLGGNLILIGQAPHQLNKKWRVGIRNPIEKTSESISQIVVGDCAVGSSGIAERYLEVGGKSYHHILDPQTGFPHDNELASVTVLTKNSLIGEIESTRLFFSDGKLENWLENPNFYGAVFVYKDKKIKTLGIPLQCIHISDSRFRLDMTSYGKIKFVNVYKGEQNDNRDF